MLKSFIPVKKRKTHTQFAGASLSNYAIPGAIIITFSLYKNPPVQKLFSMMFLSASQGGLMFTRSGLCQNHYCPSHILSPLLSPRLPPITFLEQNLRSIQTHLYGNDFSSVCSRSFSRTHVGLGIDVKG